MKILDIIEKILIGKYKEFSTNHKNINLKNNFNLEILTDLIKYHDQPLCTISYLYSCYAPRTNQ